MKKALKLTTTLLGVCALGFFNLNCGGDHDHEGHDHDADGHHEKGENKEAGGAIDGGGKSAAAGGVPDTYPLKTCVVSGEELGSMGEPFVIVHEGTTVKFCCDGCVDDFKEDPAPYLAKLVAAAAIVK